MSFNPQEILQKLRGNVIDNGVPKFSSKYLNQQISNTNNKLQEIANQSIQSQYIFNTQANDGNKILIENQQFNTMPSPQKKEFQNTANFQKFFENESDNFGNDEKNFGYNDQLNSQNQNQNQEQTQDKIKEIFEMFKSKSNQSLNPQQQKQNQNNFLNTNEQFQNNDDIQNMANNYFKSQFSNHELEQIQQTSQVPLLRQQVFDQMQKGPSLINQSDTEVMMDLINKIQYLENHIDELQINLQNNNQDLAQVQQEKLQIQNKYQESQKLQQKLQSKILMIQQDQIKKNNKNKYFVKQDQKRENLPLQKQTSQQLNQPLMEKTEKENDQDQKLNSENQKYNPDSFWSTYKQNMEKENQENEQNPDFQIKKEDLLEEDKKLNQKNKSLQNLRQNVCNISKNENKSPLKTSKPDGKLQLDVLQKLLTEFPNLARPTIKIQINENDLI
ncbi:hypothetical protein PPERSA_01777 [Pseudocohnilembus persalinus]|uniref:Uncharacterized protein n=1 Tax=Pseudocohnilembus persalinus TaxID=266149 RepID=A0A0V0R1C1_PSEPJ|nr:hypothetical protein PPERSA_01777 [Pseudocohnilembus persalinus]|eukprot:KRX08316.1 hypothetical protein PPERSA_01777 [Pseudocohnilembus persalinus]